MLGGNMEWGDVILSAQSQIRSGSDTLRRLYVVVTCNIAECKLTQPYSL